MAQHGTTNPLQYGLSTLERTVKSIEPSNFCKSDMDVRSLKYEQVQMLRSTTTRRPWKSKSADMVGLKHSAKEDDMNIIYMNHARTNLIAMASNLLAMASNLTYNTYNIFFK